MAKKVNNVAIVLDEASKKAKALLRLIKKYPLSLEDCVLVLGGDGTMLRALHQHNFEPVFLGLNCGYKGFLMNNVDGDFMNKLINREFEIHEFPLLEIEAENGWKGLALEIYFNRVSGKTCKVKVAVDGTIISERIAGDGIDIATALSSSGYFLPICGTAIHPKLPVICFAPIVRNAPFQITPMIFPIISVLEITLLSPPEEVRGWCDGMDIPYFKKIEVRKSDKTLKLAFWKGENFTKRLVEKTMKVPEVENG